MRLVQRSLASRCYLARAPAKTISVSARFFASSSPTAANIRWGILGAGAISTDFAKAVQYTPGAEVTAVAARSASRAQEFAKEHSIPRSYGNYEELLVSDPNIDVVYIGTIADTHADMARMALQNGKPTVVEKPLTTSYEETKALISLAREQEVFFLEGMWTRFFPAMKRVRQLIHEEGAIGRPVLVSGDFGWPTQGCDEHHRIWFPSSGGMIYDVAMYLAQIGLAAFEGDSIYKTTALGVTQSMGGGGPVDHTALVSCQFDNQRKGFLQFHVTGEARTEERAVIQGTQGRIVLENHHIPTSIQLHQDDKEIQVLDFPLPDDSFTTWNHPASIGFAYQIEAVGKAIQNGDLECQEYTWRESLEVAKLLEDIRGQVISGDTNN